MRLVQLIAAACAVAALAGVAEARTARVSTIGYDLAKAEDVARLHQRVAETAFSVCDTGERTTLAGRAERAACARVAIDSAVETAAIPTLAALHGNLEATVRYSRGVRKLTPVLVAAVEAAAEPQIAARPVLLAAR